MDGAAVALGLAAAFLFVQLAISAWAAAQLPPTGPVPTHFNIRGKADGFGSRWITLGILPVSYVLISALMLAMSLNTGPTPPSELVAGQVVLGLSLLAAHGFVVFLLLRWVQSQ